MDGSGGSQGGERPSGLHALGQMALRRPVVAFLLILGLVSLYPLEQFLANYAAYWANLQLRANASLTQAQADAAHAIAPIIDLNPGNYRKPDPIEQNVREGRFKSRDDLLAYAKHAAIDGGECDPALIFLPEDTTKSFEPLDRQHRLLPRCIIPEH